MNRGPRRKVIKTWSRRSTVIPRWSATPSRCTTGEVQSGVRDENMVGHKLGEFAPTRLFKGTRPRWPNEGGDGRARRAGAAAAAGGEARRRELVMIEAQATARYVRTRPEGGLVLELIRGKDVNRALATLSSRARRSPATSRRCCGRRLPTRRQGRIQRRRRSAVRVGVLREPGTVAEAGAPAPMGRAFRVLKRTAHLTVHVSGAAGKGRRGRRRGRRAASGRAPGAAKKPRPPSARRRRRAKE
jgi:ribosomal protein L22